MTPLVGTNFFCFIPIVKKNFCMYNPLKEELFCVNLYSILPDCAPSRIDSEPRRLVVSVLFEQQGRVFLPTFAVEERNGRFRVFPRGP